MKVNKSITFSNQFSKPFEQHLIELNINLVLNKKSIKTNLVLTQLSFRSKDRNRCERKITNLSIISIVISFSIT